MGFRRHTTKLKDMSDQTNVSLEELMNTYTDKLTQYVYRDLKQHKSFDYLTAINQRIRAIEVMEAYATKNLNYKPQ